LNGNDFSKSAPSSKSLAYSKKVEVSGYRQVTKKFILLSSGKLVGTMTGQGPDTVTRYKCNLTPIELFAKSSTPQPSNNTSKTASKLASSELPVCSGSAWTNCFGTRTFVDGEKYVGEFRDNKRHGQGVMTYGPSTKWAGDKYVGEYRDNKRHGQGTYDHASGAKYVGEFRDNKRNGEGTYTYADGKVNEGIWSDNKFQYAKKGTPTITSTITASKTPSAAEIEVQKLRKENARLKEQQKQQSKQVAEKKPEPKSSTSGSGFFISKAGHLITNQHVVDNCKTITVGDNARKQVGAEVLGTDRRNDLALLKISSLKMASVETQSLIQKLGIKIVPLASDGLLRSEDVDLGEDILVAGYPYGEMFSNSIKVTKGIVSASKGMGDDTGQFQMDAAVQPGNSGGPIYDEYGNIVGVVVAQLNKMKFAKQSGSIPENVNFGIKASTVRQFLTSSGLPTKWSKRSKVMSTKDLAKIAEKQTVMVICHR